MRYLRTLSSAVLLVISMMPVPSGPAVADVLLPKEVIELAPELLDMVDKAVKIATNDLPSLVSEDVGLSEYAKRVARVHFGHEFPKEPAINGDRVFSPNPEERAAARKEYADFVAAESHDIERIKARREDRVAASKLYEQIEKRASEFANRAPDLIDAAGKANNYELALSIADRLLAIEHAKPDLYKIVTEYQRLIKEYDEAIKIAELQKETHKTVLSTLEAVMPPNDYRPREEKKLQLESGQKLKPDSASSPTPLQPSYADQIQSTVNNSTASTAYRAAQTSASIDMTRQRIGPPPSAPRSTYTPMPSQQRGEPDYSASMSVYGNRR